MNQLHRLSPPEGGSQPASAVLVVIGPGPLADSRFDQALREIGGLGQPNGQLDLLMFRDDSEGSIAEQVRSAWPGQVRELSGAQYLACIDETTRDSISEFASGLRERLVSIALSTGGRRWASRFGSLWWRTPISEKNSPADGSWWQLFRAAALRRRLQEQSYSQAVLVGDEAFVRLGEQVASQCDVETRLFVQPGERFRLYRTLLARGAGCLFLLLAIALAKWHRRRSRGSLLHYKEQPPSHPPLLYTWFPWVWTDRFGDWKDMYYGNLVRDLAQQTSAEPILALRMYDSTKFVTPVTYLSRLKVLSDPQRAPQRYVLLEAFGRLRETLRLYANPRDASSYLMMTRHSEFKQAFLWEGLDVGVLFKKRIWRSVLVFWPHLQVLHNNAMRLAQRVQPGVVALYCFEFAYGRAIIEGTRQGMPGAPILGMQHGPISPMKLLYAGTEAERVLSVSGGSPLPEPDVYAVDGPLASRILEGRGIPRERIRAIGPARFDDVWTEARSLQQANEGKGHGTTRILVAPGLHDTAFVVGMALQALGQDPRLELVLKPHPKVSDGAVSRWVGSQGHDGVRDGAKVTVVREGSIYEWMARSEIFLATYSSTAVEALAFGLPVVLLVPNHTPDMSLFHGQHVPVMKASTADELKGHVERLVADETFAQDYVYQLSGVLEDVFGPTDSQASLRLARLCAEMAATRAATAQRAEVG